MKRLSTSFFILALISVLWYTGCGKREIATGSIHNPKGSVEARKSTSAAYSSVKENDPVSTDNEVKTGEDSGVELSFPGKGVVTLKSESYFKVGAAQDLGLQTKGAAVYRIDKQNENLKVATPQGVTAVLGTLFFLQIGTDTTTIVLKEGKVTFTNSSGISGIRDTVTLSPGEMLVAQASGRLATPTKLDPFTCDQIFVPGAKPPAIFRH